jgi:hypothetical protein
MFNLEWNDAQKAHREKFKQAIAYAKAAMAYPKSAAAMKKKPQKRISVCSICQSPITSKVAIFYNVPQPSQAIHDPNPTTLSHLPKVSSPI